MRYLLAFIPWVLASPLAEAKCAYSGLVPTVLAGTADVAIAKDGGILVAATSSHDGKLDPGDAAVVPAWKLRGGAAPAIETLAPGLAVYRGAPGAKSLELEDAARRLVGKAHAASTDEPKLAAPKVKRVTAKGSRGYHGSMDVIVEADVPAGAVAIIAADAKGVARSWGRVEAGKPVVVFAERYCAALPNGTVASKPGDSITLAWVDASGRKSPASAPVVVGGTITNNDG